MEQLFGFEEIDKQLKEKFHYPINSDFSYRNIKSNDGQIVCTIYFISSIVDMNQLEDNLIEPLKQADSSAMKEYVITANHFNKVLTIEQATAELNKGSAIVLFRDGFFFASNAQKFAHRSVPKAENEPVIKGPKEAFVESASINKSLIRKRIRDENLIAETMEVGNRSKNEVTLMYIKDIVNEDILTQIREKIKAINVDNVQNINLLDQYLEERRYSLVPVNLYTERPDRAVAYIEEGHVVLLMDHTSGCLIAPMTFWAMMHTSEDHFMRFWYGNFSRFIRMIAFFIAIFTPAIYIALTNYHSEMIPPDLLLAIAATREKVPFPVIFEIIIMEIAFELLREAGLRIPNPIGPTIGIVGALILGQAAVDANIVSPIMVIVIAITGLSSFALSDVSLNYMIRMSRFLFTFAAASFGILGMVAVFLFALSYMASMKSYGVPYFSPVAPHYKSSNDTFFRKILTKETWRPGFLKPKDMKRKVAK
ncbi:spore germination protein [Lottiidibacillus patelloidae]|uniref:Spore germination protein n=1 Tax=Lottiidibacillus patelloidae TaxID=2670334 RepID=A0A263BY60_9BACI|nr:spore germination protein [Lottiidibacillus patelloidae]OZM58701.1 spore germination protein [Lottiidibacillus patelloidae]